MIEFGDQYYLGLTLLTTTVIQLTFFGVAYFLQFDKLTDFAGAINFIFVALLSFFGSEQYDSRRIAITACVVLWAIRIGGFLFYRILKTGKDDRFDEIRSHFFKFLTFWIFQIFWVWLVSLPAILTNSPGFSFNVSFGTGSDIVGMILFSVGLLIETVADIQKLKFNFNRSSRLSVMNTGLWYYSRHPNYFGEFIVWWGIFIISTSNRGNSIIWLGLLSPLTTMGLLLFFSGIPQSEPKKDKSINECNDSRLKEIYYDYLHSTSPVILLPPTLYRSFPKLIKFLFFFEFPIYRHNPERTSLINNNSQ